MGYVKSTLIDRISNLPNNVMESILMCLPIRDAVRSSILSREWRHVWTKLPQLVMDETLWKEVATGKESAKSVLKHVLYHLLLSHDGPITIFTLSYPQLPSCTEIDSLICFLTRKNHLEDFTLEMWKDCYSLPYSIISCQTLKCLSLRLCSIKSFSSVGFSKLTSLKLVEVIISVETLASLISGSPLLDLLEIESHLSNVEICIDAPNLRSLDVEGSIKSINFKRVPSLDWLSIYLDSDDEDDIVDFIGVERNIANLFGCLPALETLQLTFHVCQSFGDEIPKRLQTSLIHLKDVSLYDIGLNEMVDLSFTLCLLRSSPILEYLEISFKDYHGSTSEETRSYMEMKDFLDMCLSELRKVTLSDVTGTKPELEFIRLLLAMSPNLKKIQIQPVNGVVDKGFDILNELAKFPRRSNEAEIIFSK